MLRVLLIDDNPDDRLLVTRELNREFSDLEIQSVIDAVGLEIALTKGEFDIVITDYQLRWNDGLDVLNSIKTRYPDRPVIMFTDSGSEEVAVKGMKQGLSDYLSKRQSLHRLSIALRETLEKQRMQREYAIAIEQLNTSERQFRLAMEAADMGFWNWDISVNRVTWSYNHAQLMGMTADEFDGSYASFISRVHPDDRVLLEQAIGDAFVNGGDYEAEFRVVWRDSSIHWLAGKGKVFFDSADQPMRMMGVIRDTTDRRLSEEALKQQAAELARANRIKDEFLAVLSHELRSPLTPILGWAKLLQTRKYDEAATLRALQTIERNAELQTRLIEDLLDISRIIQGKLRLSIRPVSLVECVEGAIDTMRLASEAKAIDLQFIRAYKAPQFDGSDTEALLAVRSEFLVSGDSNRLQQVFWNLLSNAIKFTPAGGKVEVRLTLVEEEALFPSCRACAQITVVDTGKGIKPEFLPYVFDYFRQEDGSASRANGGLGLGLAIVRHLIELHGGRVYADSLGEGQGATFVVRLPIMQASARVEAIDNGTAPRDESPLLGVRVLVVDDEADSQNFIASLLSLQGAEVLAVSSARAALDTIASFRPDLLVSDIGMPDIDGYALLRQIRSQETQPDSLPAIALTAYAREEDRHTAFSAGFQLHLAKPVDPDELATAIASLTGR